MMVLPAYFGGMLQPEVRGQRSRLLYGKLVDGVLSTVLALIDTVDDIAFNLQHCLERRVREDRAAQRVFYDVPASFAALACAK